MIRTQFNNQPKFAVLELRMGRHMNLFDRRVVLTVVNTASYTNSVIISNDEVPPGYRVYLWGACFHTNADLTNSSVTILTTNGTALINSAYGSVTAAAFVNMMASATAALSAVTIGSVLNTAEFADDGYGLMVSQSKNGAVVQGDATITVRAWGCVAPAQLTTAQWIAGAAGAGSGTGSGNDQQIR